MDKFEAFLARAGSYHTVFATPTALSRATQPSRSSTSAKPVKPATRQQLILLEDLPNILHPSIRARFHAALREHVERAGAVAGAASVVVVLSDAGVRGEAGES